MGVPIAIFVVCFGGGAFASSRWLPELAGGLVGGLAFLVVCGLLGAALVVVGLDIYSMVENLSGSGVFSREFNGRLLAGELTGMSWQAGSLLALAAVVYLLAPRAPAAEEGAMKQAA